ncbi:heavy metal translocating P-type ATPase [Vibrio chaetopteri]|uniref:heavy metal translocating P-type ATPase n=1 Tax=Vibrio chaetopteri TaxID=3016528 RepID=UPI003AB6F0F9
MFSINRQVSRLVMVTYTLNLSGLSCMGCVKKVRNALEQASANIKIKQLDKHALTVSTDANIDDIIQPIANLGFEAKPVWYFELSGLNCGKCVAKLQAQLETLDSSNIIALSKQSLTIESNLGVNLIQDNIEQVGFRAVLSDASQAEIASSELSNTTENKPSDSVKASATSSPASSQSDSSIQLLIQGMTCASCVSSVEKALQSVVGVDKARVNLAEQSALVLTSLTNSDIEQPLLQAIKEAGYQGEIVEDLASTQKKQQQALQQHQALQKRNTYWALAMGAPLMLWGVLGGSMTIQNSTDQLAWGVVGLLCLWLLATAGRAFYANAYQALKHKRATMDTLVALGTGAAWLYSMLVVLMPSWFPEASRHVYFEASAMIIGLISLGHFIEAKAKAKTNQSLQALMNLQPQVATAIIDGQDISLAVGDIQLGMLLRIKPGEKVPVDGEVIEGHSYLDESMLTGEPIAVLKGVKDSVSAGTVNTDGSLVIKATGIGANTMLSRIIHMVRDAQSSKPAIAKLADSISAVFVPAVVAIALLAALVWFFIGPEPKASYMLVVTTTVLIIACPCALGLATPLSITVGIGKAAQAGILIKDADALQKLSKVNAVVFDKTGTLTLGQPRVQTVHPIGISETELAKWVVPLEKRSEHPLAKAVTDYWSGANPLEPEQFENLKGKGVQGIVDGKRIVIASINHIKTLGIDLQALEIPLAQAANQAHTPIVVAIEGQAVALIAIADGIKTDAANAVNSLKTQGIHTIMLTGDNQHVASVIGEQLGIDEVISEVLPDEKAAHIASLKGRHQHVAMVGDGINDAPALALADVGIAMGTGSDVAIESAPMTLLNSNPASVSYAISLSRATVRNIKQNLFGAFIYNTLGIPIAAGVLYPLFGFLLSPVFAGAAMALSSITVVTNANRLRKFQHKG